MITIFERLEVSVTCFNNVIHLCKLDVLTCIRRVQIQILSMTVRLAHWHRTRTSVQTSGSMSSPGGTKCNMWAIPVSLSLKSDNSILIYIGFVSKIVSCNWFVCFIFYSCISDFIPCVTSLMRLFQSAFVLHNMQDSNIPW
jgi:hypothetical protein